MPIYAGDWLDPEDLPFFPDSAPSIDGGQGKTCHVVHKRPNERPTGKQLAVRSAMTTAARLWSESMTPPDQAYWLDNDWPFNNRKGLPAPVLAYPRFYNVNVPLLHSGQAPIYATPGNRYYLIDDISLNALSVVNQEAQLSVTYGRIFPGLEYHIVHVFQVHPTYVDTPLAHNYTMWLGTKTLNTAVDWPPGVTETDWFPVYWPLVSGQDAQLFVAHTYDDEPGGPPFGWGAVTTYHPSATLILTAP